MELARLRGTKRRDSSTMPARSAKTIRRWVSSLIVGLAALAVPVAMSGAGAGLSFAPATTVATQSGVGNLTEIESGDLNGDGRDDLVVTRIACCPVAHQTFPIGIYLGDGQGGFVDGSSMWDGPPARTEHGRQILIADFNGDHRNDIFVADHGYDAPPFPGHANALALSTPAGKLVDASANMPAESGFSHSATAADVNHDGSVDLYVGNLCTYCTDAPPEILLNDGSGHFTRRTDLLPSDLRDLDDAHRYTRSLFMDANGDGSPDLVLGADDHTVTSRVLLNDGSGHFHDAPAPFPAKPLGPTSILISLAALDINRDGRTDLLAGFTPGNPFYMGRRLQILINDGGGAFRDETAERLPQQDGGAGWPVAIRISDMNGDGHPDFGVSVNGAFTERAPIYLDAGDGVYRPVQAPSSQPFFVFVDANRDGHPDIVSAVGGQNEHVDVQLQLVPPARPEGVHAAGLRNGIHISWKPVTGATGYEIWRSQPGRARRLIDTTTRTRFDDRHTGRGVRYSYSVRAVNSVGKSPFSALVTARRRSS